MHKSKGLDKPYMHSYESSISLGVGTMSARSCRTELHSRYHCAVRLRSFLASWIVLVIVCYSLEVLSANSLAGACAALPISRLRASH